MREGLTVHIGDRTGFEAESGAVGAQLHSGALCDLVNETQEVDFVWLQSNFLFFFIFLLLLLLM